MRAKTLIFGAGKHLKSMFTGRYAIVTNTVTAGLISCAGDAICQRIEMRGDNEREFSARRNFNMTAVGTALGPVDHLWYALLDGKLPGAHSRAVKIKVALDVLFAVPYTAVCVYLISLLKGNTVEGSASEVKDKLPILFTVDTIGWTVLQTINFAFAPAYLRVVVLKLNELVLGVFDSHVINNEYTVQSFLFKIRKKIGFPGLLDDDMMIEETVTTPDQNREQKIDGLHLVCDARTL